ncbi:hypothetical protein RFI_28733, partial [Reticulomyxa filosa]
MFQNAKQDIELFHKHNVSLVNENASLKKQAQQGHREELITFCLLCFIHFHRYGDSPTQKEFPYNTTDVCGENSPPLSSEESKLRVDKKESHVENLEKKPSKEEKEKEEVCDLRKAKNSINGREKLKHACKLTETGKTEKKKNRTFLLLSLFRFLKKKKKKKTTNFRFRVYFPEDMTLQELYKTLDGIVSVEAITNLLKKTGGILAKIIHKYA